MAAENDSLTNDASGWSSTPGVKATVDTVLAASRLAEMIIAAGAAHYKANSSMDALIAVELVSIIIAVAGVVLNVSAFAAVYRTHMRNRALRLGLLSLACSDLLLALSNIVVLGLRIDGVFTEDAELALFSDRSQYCAKKVGYWMWDVCNYAQLFTIALLAVQQFVVFRWPLHTADGMSSRSSAYALAVLWLVSALLGLAPAIAIAVRSEHHPWTRNWTQMGTTRLCYELIIYYYRNDAAPSDYTFDLGQYEVSLGLTICAFAAMCAVLPVVIGSYGYVAHTMKKTRPGDGFGGSAAETAAAVKRRRDTKRVPIVTATVTLLCLATNLPPFVHNTLCERVFSECSVLRGRILMAVGALSTVADPLVYTLRLPAVRQVVLSPLSRCRSCLTKSSKRRSVKLSCDDPRTQQTTTTHLEFEQKT